MYNIVCVYRTNKPNIYSPEYVYNLQRMVEKNLTLPYRFVCLTNSDLLCDTIPLINNWPVWWSKVELFRKGLFVGKVLYFDLDTVLFRNIDSMLEQIEGFVALRPFNPKRARRENYFASGILGFEADKYNFIYDAFKTEFMDEFRGDQDYFSYVMNEYGKGFSFWQDKVDGIYSYKRDLKYRKINDTRVVCFHGSPRPHEIKNRWLNMVTV